MFFGYYAAKWSSGARPLRPWLIAYVCRLIAALNAMIVVWLFPSAGVGRGYFLAVIMSHMATCFAQTVMFVSSAAFHTQIADPEIGGTYMTTLNTVSNLGGTFPRFFVLQLVDYFTKATCVSDMLQPFSCALEQGKMQCLDLGGRCKTVQDGYYVMGILCLSIGTAVFFSFIRPHVLRLQGLPQKSWRVTR